MKNNLMLHWILCIFFLSSGIYESARAHVGLVITGNSDVIYIRNPYVDLQLKVDAINQARSAIWISTYVIGKDDFGFYMIAALRRALNRGVSVRIIHESSNTRLLGKDFFLSLNEALLDSHLKKRAQIIELSLTSKFKVGLDYNDYVHSKLLIVDPGTTREIVCMGRDASLFASNVIDSSYFIRPVNAVYPHVGQQVSRYFSNLWNHLSPIFPVLNQPHETTTPYFDMKTDIERFNWIPTEFRKIYLQTKKILFSPLSAKPQELLAHQFRPETSQFLSNDTLFRKLNRRGLYDQQTRLGSDDIVDELIKKIHVARSVEVSSYSAAMTRPLLDALKAFIRTGHLRIFTNGRDILNGMPWPGLTRAVNSFNLQAFQELTSADLQGSHLDLQLMDAKKRTTNSFPDIYFHRKQMLIDDSLIAVGSHNFTHSSTYKNDEFMILFQDIKMNAFLKKQSDEEIAQTFTSFNPDSDTQETWVDKASVKLLGPLAEEFF